MNDEILELREEIEGYDKNIVETLEKRFEICKKIGEIKIESEIKVFDELREEDEAKDVKFKTLFEEMRTIHKNEIREKDAEVALIKKKHDEALA